MGAFVNISDYQRCRILEEKENLMQFHISYNDIMS